AEQRLLSHRAHLLSDDRRAPAHLFPASGTLSGVAQRAYPHLRGDRQARCGRGHGIDGRASERCRELLDGLARQAARSGKTAAGSRLAASYYKLERDEIKLGHIRRWRSNLRIPLM